MKDKSHVLNQSHSLKILIGFLSFGFSSPLFAQTADPTPVGAVIPSLVLTPITGSSAQPLPSFFSPAGAVSSPDETSSDAPASLTNSPNSSKTLPAPSGECYIPLGLFGVRVSTDLAFFNLADYHSNINQLNAQFTQLKAGAPSYGYYFQGAGPNNAVVLGVTPLYPLTQDFEVGLNFDDWVFTPFTFDAGDIHPQYFHHVRWDLSSLELNAASRLYFLKTKGNGTEFFLEAEAGIQPDTSQYSQNYQNTGNSPPTDQNGDNCSTVAFDASLKVGAALDIGKGFLLSLKGGYQYSYATNFTGAFWDAQDASRNGVKGSIMMFNDSSTGYNYSQFVPNDSSQYANFGITQAQVSAARKLVMDLSGLRLAMDLSYQF